MVLATRASFLAISLIIIDRLPSVSTSGRGLQAFSGPLVAPHPRTGALRVATTPLGLRGAHHEPRRPHLYGLRKATATIAADSSEGRLLDMHFKAPRIRLPGAAAPPAAAPDAELSKFGCVAWDGSEAELDALLESDQTTIRDTETPPTTTPALQALRHNAADTAQLLGRAMIAPLTTASGLLTSLASTYTSTAAQAWVDDDGALGAHVAVEQEEQEEQEEAAEEALGVSVGRAEALMYKLEGRVVERLEGWHMLSPALKPPLRPHPCAPGHPVVVVGHDVRAREALLRETAAEMNKLLIDRVTHCETDAPWKLVSEKEGVKIWSAQLGKDVLDWPHGLGPAAKGLSRFEAIMARGVITHPPEDVFALFSNNDLVHEYNEFCAEIEDVMVLDEDTKITWGGSRKVGPFSPRDFVTRCYLGKDDKGVWLAVNLAEDLPCTEQRRHGLSVSYCRMEILLGGTIGRPIEGGTQTEYTILCLTNPGGAADSALGASVMNKIAASGPVSHIHAIQTMCDKYSPKGAAPAA